MNANGKLACWLTLLPAALVFVLMVYELALDYRPHARCIDARGNWNSEDGCELRKPQ